MCQPKNHESAFQVLDGVSYALPYIRTHDVEDLKHGVAMLLKSEGLKPMLVSQNASKLLILTPHYLTPQPLCDKFCEEKHSLESETSRF